MAETIKVEKRHRRVLLWPESCQKVDQSAGLVVGWRQRSASHEHVLVAGILETKQHSDIARELEFYQKRLNSLVACCCCSCDVNSPGNDHICAGCTRKLLQNLEVVAFYSLTETSETTICGLPVICNSKGTPYRIENETGGEQQLVFFRDFGRNNTHPIYRFSRGLSKESSSVHMLTRIEYSSRLMKELRLPVNNDSLGEVECSPRRPACRKHSTMALPGLALKHSFLCRHLAGEVSGFKLFRVIHHIRASFGRKHESLAGTCSVCQKYTAIAGTHREVADERTRRLDDFLRFLVDAALGFLIGFFLASHWADSGRLQTALYSQYQLLRDAMEWLNSFPIGFKLNERMTAAISRKVCTLIDLHEGLAKAIVSKVLLEAGPPLMLCVSTCLGAAGTLSLLLDLLQLGLSHVLFFTCLFGSIYRAELEVLHALWCLFRGKKRNILRQRTDTMEYDSTQLLFGTILFVVALFLFTTILVYHIFFAALYLLLVLSLTPALLVYVVIQDFPLGALVHRATTDWFLIDFFLEHDEVHSTQSLDVTKLQTTSKCYSSIVWENLAAPLRTVAVYATSAARWLATARP